MSVLGQPVSIIRKDESTGHFELDEAALSRVLLRDDVKDKPVCVVAVAGGFRKGKSFLLNYFLRYLANQCSENCLGEQDDPLTGFSWVNDFERETTGILIWSEPYIVKKQNGEQIAVILMDTQGTFDAQSSAQESTVVFALSLLTSSVLVYNLMGNIGEDDLMHLDTFTQYGLLASKGSSTTNAFQKLLFLVRDWKYPQKLQYGLQDGEMLLKKRLEINDNQLPAHQDLRRNIEACFSDIGCYLMPHPGEQVIETEHFNGSLSKLSDKFVDHLETLVSHLLAPENVVKKTHAGQPITAEDLFQSFKIYVEAFKSNELPEVTTVVEHMAMVRCEAALRKASQHYDKEMNNAFPMDREMTPDELDKLHSHWSKSAVALYKAQDTINQRISERYEQQLAEDLDSLCFGYEQRNQARSARKLNEKYLFKATNKVGRALSPLLSLFTAGNDSRDRDLNYSDRGATVVAVGGVVAGGVAVGAFAMFAAPVGFGVAGLALGVSSLGAKISVSSNIQKWREGFRRVIKGAKSKLE